MSITDLLLDPEEQRWLRALKKDMPILLERISKMEIQVRAIAYYLSQEDAKRWHESLVKSKADITKENAKLKHTSKLM